MSQLKKEQKQMTVPRKDQLAAELRNQDRYGQVVVGELFECEGGTWFAKSRPSFTMDNSQFPSVVRVEPKELEILQRYDDDVILFWPGGEGEVLDLDAYLKEEANAARGDLNVVSGFNYSAGSSDRIGRHDSGRVDGHRYYYPRPGSNPSGHMVWGPYETMEPGRYKLQWSAYYHFTDLVRPEWLFALDIVSAGGRSWHYKEYNTSFICDPDARAPGERYVYGWRLGKILTFEQETSDLEVRMKMLSRGPSRFRQCEFLNCRGVAVS